MRAALYIIGVCCLGLFVMLALPVLAGTGGAGKLDLIQLSLLLLIAVNALGFATLLGRFK